MPHLIDGENFASKVGVHCDSDEEAAQVLADHQTMEAVRGWEAASDSLRRFLQVAEQAGKEPPKAVKPTSDEPVDIPYARALLKKWGGTQSEDIAAGCRMWQMKNDPFRLPDFIAMYAVRYLDARWSHHRITWEWHPDALTGRRTTSTGTTEALIKYVVELRQEKNHGHTASD